MKLLLILHAGSRPERVADVLAREAGGFTTLRDAHGAGRSGRVEGTRAWPGSTTLFLAIVPEERAAAVEQALRALSGSEELAGTGDRLHVATMPVERFF